MTNKEKACPIARPSRDYAWKIASRDYDGEKEAREEARRLEAEAREKAREQGEKVDLGLAGDYWEKVADPNKPKEKAKAFSARPSASSGWNAAASPAVWRPSASTSSQSGSDAWASWTGKKIEAGAEDKRPSASSRPASGKAPAPATNGWSSGNNGSGQSDNWNNGWNDGWSESSASKPGRAVDARSAPSRVPPGSERSYTQEDKAKREAARKRQMEERRQGQASQAQPIAGLPSRSSGGYDDAARPAPPERARDVSNRLDREQLEPHLPWAAVEALMSTSQSWGRRNLDVLDLSGSTLSLDALSVLVQFLSQEHIVVEKLMLHGTRALRLDAAVLERLLSDPVAGIAGGFRELHLEAVNVTPDCCWRLCGIFKSKQQSQAVRLCFHSKSWQEIKDAQLFQPLSMAMDHGLKVAGLNAFAAAGFGEAPELDEAKADLVVSVVVDEAENPMTAGTWQ